MSKKELLPSGSSFFVRKKVLQEIVHNVKCVVRNGGRGAQNLEAPNF